MASERQRTKGQIGSREREEATLDEALAQAEAKQLDISREDHRHKETLQSQEFGLVGRWLGGPHQASLSAAALVAFAALLAVLACVVAMLWHPQSIDAFERPLTLSAGLVTTALAYLFGARSNRPR